MNLLSQKKPFWLSFLASGMMLLFVSLAFSTHTQSTALAQVNLPVDDEERCNLLRDWFYEGELTANLGGDISEAIWCDKQNFDWWKNYNNKDFYGPGYTGVLPHSGPLPSDDEERCNLLRDWFYQGILTPKLNGDISEAIWCDKQNSTWWKDYDNFDFYNLDGNYNGSLPFDDVERCNLLHDWYWSGTLTDNLGGDISEAVWCDRQNTWWWRDPNAGDFFIDNWDEWDDYDYGNYNEFYFVNSAGSGDGTLEVFWDASFAPGVTEFETYYDVFDVNGEYLFGSDSFYTNGNTNQFQFPFNPIISTSESQEIIIVVNAFDDLGFLASDSIVHLTQSFESNYNPRFDSLGLETSHSYGTSSIVDLFVGEEITFYGYPNPANGFRIQDMEWEQFPSEILDCTTSNDLLRYDCVAVAPGDTDVSILATATNPSGSTFQEYSTSTLVYVYEDFGGFDLCPTYDEPFCPNGVIYYPPTADGCFGQPICQNIGQNISAPLQGFEDEVIVRTREEAGITSNIFPDTETNSLVSIAANELYLRGVIGGYQDGEFKGKRLVNRAEAAKFLLLAREILIRTGLSEADNPFWDVIISEWYGPYVVSAAEKGIIEGHPDGSFKPGENVNKAEFLAMLARTFDLPTNLDSSKYKDEAKWKNTWIGDYAGISAQYDLFPNHDQSILDPGRKLTRSDVAIAIYQYLRNRNR